MILYLLVCNIILIPLVFCSNTTVSQTDLGNKTVSETHMDKLSNVSKVSLASEGGSLLPDTLLMALPKANTLNTHTELAKNKVVGRKGVNFSEPTTKLEENLTLSKNGKSTIKPKTSSPKSNAQKEQQINATKLNDISAAKSTLLNKMSSSSNEAKDENNISNITKTYGHIKKPLILNSDVENMTVKSSPGTSNQMISPNTEVKSYKTTAKNPGMVMPIVITILLVPMFAVLGYMALRRGQEAWKNRHYKRMDFLLDGMYND